MKAHLIIFIYLSCILLFGCVGDGVEYKKKYTHSDNIIETPDSRSNKLERAQYHFELGLKMAKLDLDEIGDYKGAISELNKSIDLNPNFMKAYHYRAIIYSYLNNIDSAMIDINKVLSIENKNIESHFVRAGLYSNKGEYYNVIKDLDTIIEIDPKNGKAYDRRGYAKLQVGLKIEGCKDLKKARELGFMTENKEGDKLICN